MEFLDFLDIADLQGPDFEARARMVVGRGAGGFEEGQDVEGAGRGVGGGRLLVAAGRGLEDHGFEERVRGGMVVVAVLVVGGGGLPEGDEGGCGCGCGGRGRAAAAGGGVG